MKIKMLFFIPFITCYMTSSCEKEDTIIGSGELVDHPVDFPIFNKIFVEGQAAITVTYGDIQKVTISAQENVYEVMDNHVLNGKLFIGFKKNSNVNTSKDIAVTIEIPTPIIDFSVFGSSSLDISGPHQDVFSTNIFGSGALNAFDLDVSNVNIEISGSGSCKVTAIKNLNVKINGSGKVLYKGNPKINQSISGSGSIINAN